MGGVELTSRDPILRVITSFYKEKLGGFARFCIITVGLVGGVLIVSTGLEVLLQYQKQQAFLYGIILYAFLLLIAFFTYGVFITRSLFTNPRQLFGYSTELEPLLNEWMGKLYGIERTLMKEECVINLDGSFRSKYELITTATAKNVNAIEIQADYLGPLPDTDLTLESFQVTPKDFGPVTPKKMEYMKGWYELRFAKDLPTDRSVTIEYEEVGGPDCFATSPDKYARGIPFDFLTKETFYPTRMLIIEIYFKEGYPLVTVADRPRVVVWYGNAKIEHTTETTRVGRYFRYEHEIRRATLRLPSPILGLHYTVRWAVEYKD